VAILNLIRISTGSQWRWARRESAGRWRYGEYERTIWESVFCVQNQINFQTSYAHDLYYKSNNMLVSTLKITYIRILWLQLL